MFSHIYIEEKAWNHPNTHYILKQLTDTRTITPPTIIPIRHYKDLFNRSNQNFELQKNHPNLILALNENSTVYKGAPVCQDFGNDHFYYTSFMMNCIYNCEYCYLQGMYPSANIVIFVNIEDTFREIETLLLKHPVYLCISYDTDLLALESIHGFVHQWADFCHSHENLIIELRTKSANYTGIQDILPSERFILAWTVSPDSTCKQYEHKTPSLQARLSAIASAMKQGHPVRLCFDPMLTMKNYKEKYTALVEEVASKIPLHQVKDISLGTFRVPADYMKSMRKQHPLSAVIQYPYENDHGVFHINNKKQQELITLMKDLLTNYVKEDKLYLWEEQSK